MDDFLVSHLMLQLERDRIGFWHALRARIVVDHVPARRPSTVADIGAGTGHLAEVLARDRPHARYRYFEPIPALRDKLVETYGSSNRMADQTDVADADVVVGLDVLEHIADDRSFLRSVVERCVEGTTLVFTAPAMPWLWSSWDVNLGHHRRYTRASFESLLSMPELDVREVSYLFPELIVPALARRLVRRNRTGSAEFPKLPPSVDRLAYLVSSATYRSRRCWPFGTSVLAVARRRGVGRGVNG